MRLKVNKWSNVFDSFLKVALTFKNRQIAKILGLYDQNWRIWEIWGVSTRLKVKKWSNFFDSLLKVVFTFKNINRNQIVGQSDNRNLKF